MLHTLLNYHCHSKVQLNLGDSTGHTAVHWAVDSGNDQCLNVLLEYAADPSVFDQSSNSPLLLAIKANQPSMLQILLEAGSRITMADGGSPLALCSLLGHNECVNALLRAGLDSNSCGHFGQTPLICAVFECHKQILDTLLEHGASPSGLSQTGATPLLAALSCLTQENATTRHAIVARLIRAGADVNFAFARAWYHNPITKAHNSPMSLAMDSGYKSLVHMLLMAGSHVSIYNFTNWQSGDPSADVYDRNDILAPIKDHLQEPLPLTFQIRQVIHKAIGPVKMEKKLKSLQIAPGLLMFLLYEELFHIAPEQARPGSRRNAGTGSQYHPFREGENIGVGDIQQGGRQMLQGTLIAKTLFGSG